MPMSYCYRQEHPEYQGKWCLCVLCSNSENIKCPKKDNPCGLCKGPVGECETYVFHYFHVDIDILKEDEK